MPEGLRREEPPPAPRAPYLHPHGREALRLPVLPLPLQPEGHAAQPPQEVAPAPPEGQAVGRAQGHVEGPVPLEVLRDGGETRVVLFSLLGLFIYLCEWLHVKKRKCDKTALGV